jgi:hypothetical protein
VPTIAKTSDLMDNLGLFDSAVLIVRVMVDRLVNQLMTCQHVDHLTLDQRVGTAKNRVYSGG